MSEQVRRKLKVAMQENARLQAEVEKWEKNTQLMGRQLNDELEQVARLKAEVERLTKAGDNLVYVASEHPVSEPFVKAWFAAKEGKQS